MLGLDLPSLRPADEPLEATLVLLDDNGRIASAEHPASLPDAAAAVARLAGEETFLLGVDLPVVVPAKPARHRPIEARIRRRFGIRLEPGGRGEQALPGETLIAGLAAAGQPCLPWPDRDRRRSGLLETHPDLVAKSLLWRRSVWAGAQDGPRREDLFEAYSIPRYRAADLPARVSWTEQAARIDVALAALAGVSGFDFEPAREALARVASALDVGRAAGLLDAALIAGTARLYLEAPESCLFLGDHEQGYVVLPADAFVRRLALARTGGDRRGLFPKGSLRERLGQSARLRDVDLLAAPGRPRKTEATFEEPEVPRYEFDNVDEMLWWKHCRHVAGVRLPTDGLRELTVELVQDGSPRSAPLRLTRSRHTTLSFRFEPPAAWRSHLATRDGRTYPFRVRRAVYEIAPSD